MLVLEIGEGRGRERQRNNYVREKNPPVASHRHPPTGDETCNLGTCPNWESSPRPFDVWDDAPANPATLVRAAWRLLLGIYRWIDNMCGHCCVEGRHVI